MKPCRFMAMVLILLAGILSTACTFSEKKKIRTCIEQELDPLTHLDGESVRTGLSRLDFFREAGSGLQDSAEIQEAFVLYYKDFSYKIHKISLSEKGDSASVLVGLRTPDGRALAKDYLSARLRKELFQAAAPSGMGAATSLSVAERYLLLDSLLKNNSYELIDGICTITLQRKESGWVILRTPALENDLTGGLVRFLADPMLLSPGETLLVYLDSIDSMDTETLSAFLGLDSLFGEEDQEEALIARSLEDQIHRCFASALSGESRNGYHAQVTASIRSFDSDAIIAAYEEKVDAYLASPEAVIDGPETRRDRVRALLTEAIRENTCTVERKTVFSMINDGASWKPEDAGKQLGEAIFGSMADLAASGTI